MPKNSGSTEGKKSSSGNIDIRIGHEELVLRGRYEIISILNDILVGLWFVVGSILFFYQATGTIAIWFFVFGSVEMLIRPVIRLVRRAHLRKYHALAPAASMDF